VKEINNGHNISGAIIQNVATCTLLLMIAAAGCVSQSGNDDRERSAKFDQYYVKGEQLYLKNCSNCHQKNGTGLGLIYPPINGSDYLQQNKSEVICLIRNGKRGELIVNGKSFNKEMPPMPLLSDLEIAEITTFIYNSWGFEEGLIEVGHVSSVLSRCDSLP
jgi:mono/diheme cytochrome c family protein